ncbi:uncharacterized protein LOC113383100 [Ctenocephalides felis]|uniref:uncharacterized protein LOC113383100 n=1 Tax=Ctenocephalides felis TaxID=7515 RepID=UPI000E6E236E|nr:uncharacterized protein LOC113383100 [Ctenocephalides felis]
MPLQLGLLGDLGPMPGLFGAFCGNTKCLGLRGVIGFGDDCRLALRKADNKPLPEMSSKKKFTSYEISSPHAKQDHSQMPFRIPVAIRKQYGKKGWTSIMATRDDRLSAETCFIAGVVLYAIAKNEISSPQGCWFHTLEQYRKNENPTAIDMYIYSVHFSVMLVTGLGLGDVTAVTVIELAVTSFVMIAGFCFAVLYFIGTLSSVMVNDAERLELYRADLIAIRDYLTDINCEEKVKNKVIRYYIELWHYKKGIKRVPSIDLLPISLRMELFHDMCMGPFKSTLLFRFLPDYFLRKLSMSMKPVFYLPGDILSHQHVAKYMMIIILSGVVHILSDEDNESPIISFDYGTCISEIGMVYTLPAKSSIRAATYLEVLTLHKLDFFRAVKEYPEIQKRIRLNIQDRIERAHKKDIYRPKKKNIFNLFVTQETEITAIKQIKKLLKAKPDLSEFITFRFQLQSAFKERFNMLLRYVSQSDVTNAVKNRLLACYVLQWYHSGGFRTAQKHQLLQKAVSFMRQDVLAAEKKKTLKKVPLFSSTNDDFIATLASGSRMDTLPPGEYVVYAGLVNRQLYIIHQGYCEIIENNTAIRTLHPGAHFCVECLLYGHPTTDMFPKYLEHEQLSFDNILAKTYKTYKKESQVLSKAKIVNSNIMRIKNLFANSLINVKKYCRRRHENYNKGFEGDNNIFKYILLPICITPQGLLLKIWCFFRILAAFCIAMLLPFDITITPYTNNFVNLIIIVSDAIAYIDLYVSMFIGYYGKQGQLIIHPMKTAKRYVSTLFILDIILCIPINKINRALPLDDYKEVEWWLNMIRLIRIGQVYRIHGAMSYLLSDILKSDRIYIIIEFIVITLVASNIWSCIFVNTTCQPYLKRADEIHMKCLEGYGFGDITPHKPVHIMHCILSILVGQLLIAFACAYIASSISTQHRTLVTFQEKLCNITSFMKRQNVSPDLRKLIHKHFLQRYKRTGGIEPMEVLNDIHTTLMEDAVHSMFEETLQIVPLFSFVEKSFFRIIALHLANRHYVKGEEIVRCNYITRNIYILHRGKVQVKNSNDEPICIIGPGAIFGRINALASKPSSVTIEALHNLDVLVIEYDIFYNILKDYPKIMHKIHNELKKDVDYILPKVIIDDDATRVSLCSKFTTNTDITGSTQVTLNTVVTMESMPKWNVVLNPRKCFRIALIPDSILCQIHSALVLIASYASTILITYQFFFHDLSLIYILPSICIDLVFILKILLDLQMAYVNKLGDYVLDVKLIRMRYLTDYKERLIDVAANLPLCYFALLVPGPFGLDLFVYLRLHHLIRIVYIIQFYNVHSRMLSSASFLLKLSWLLVWFTLLMHIFACFWFYIPCMGSKCKRGFWGEERGLAKEEHPFANYVHSLYHMTNIMTMTGHGDIKPMIPVELLLSVMFVVTTKIFVGTLIGEISYVQNLYSLEQVNYTRTVVELKHYMTNNNLSAVKQKKCGTMYDDCGLKTRAEIVTEVLEKSTPDEDLGNESRTESE